MTSTSVHLKAPPGSSTRLAGEVFWELRWSTEQSEPHLSMWLNNFLLIAIKNFPFQMPGWLSH